MTHLLDLPDDALLAVLGFLPLRQLFACRRLRDLCLHRYLWRHVSLDGENEGVVRAALALAPCLKSIECSGPSAVQASRVKTTNCVVTRLTLFVSGQSNRMALAIEMIQRLHALGGLRELRLTCTNRRTMTPLLQAVYDLRGLKTLLLDATGAQECLPAAWCDREAEPSLSDLVFVSHTANPFLQLLLKTHASTLQNVRLLTGDHVPVSSLLNIPGLRCLRCSPNVDLSPFVALPSLRTIELFDAEGYHRGALQFLREASHLRSVRLWDCTDSVLLALGESPSAPLIEQLVFTFSKRPVLKALSLALPKFHALKVLDVQSEFFDSLDTVWQVVCHEPTPRLITLVVYPFVYGDGRCLHEWLHSRYVQDVLWTNPWLHLCVRAQNLRGRCNSCSWCLEDCHQLLRRSAPRSFSSHSKKAGCPKDCFDITA
ncbi:uncharacterized protein LOC117646534 [Thrips palmi]|uniref:Uncharacterized protein LOC117646534 n=1 Tax=Thrips palmi TaxID=161013 RepID=A0A6P8Z1I0_THRPL|nr:uncharacterized protein LOC117646534 [Thrips palmi]XP_034243463.1 uncharacterized protein LOC117646534 [Thrips palmi]XP_034243472.1 uncharacterized protein LOC117646534 [Thrips palmi]XP_034243481.1 uncharacterized protein LOC117646534 [Thrips palmi]XP_034243488.1 uncharacterized protein LOC117646534 [Thrips palmi]XP_034243495.1 uncharacterized protein LOC117646534 [Thrips palmi]XP_034243501.1 uncharacterized protein LOC117646534 [Thrips palmi]XP_034243507.1 uncharacterized protein LOC1176